MKTNNLWITFVLITALLLAGCGSRARVGALRTESQSVELGDAKSVRVKILLGAGDLELTGGAEKLLEANFNYNVAKLAPEVEYKNDTLVVWQPNINGLPDLRGITDYHNEWGLRLNDQVPMDLSVDMGGGTSDLRLAGLSLTGLDVRLGAGIYKVDLSGDWTRDLNVTIDAGVANLSVRLPKDVGARVTVESGPHTIDATDLTQDGDTYTNAAFGESDVTLQVNLEAGIGHIKLEVEEAEAQAGEEVLEVHTQGDLQTAMISGWLWHDLCELEKDGEPASTTIPEVCVQEESPLGNFHADGVSSNT